MKTVTREQIVLIRNWVRTQVSPKRYVHIQGVVQTASRLAKQNGLSSERAEVAGWFHDCAKELSRAEMLKWIDKSRFRLDEEEKNIPALWHPHAGASIALNQWKIKDKDVLEAIRCHTLGSPEMSALAQVVFVADFIEPGRIFPGVEKVRRIAQKDIQEAVLLKCSMTIDYLLSHQMKIHGRLLRTWNGFLSHKASN